MQESQGGALAVGHLRALGVRHESGRVLGSAHAPEALLEALELLDPLGCCLELDFHQEFDRRGHALAQLQVACLERERRRTAYLVLIA